MRDDDQLRRALAGLPRIAADEEWELRVRARCHSTIANRVQRRARAGVLDWVTAAGLCVYLIAALAQGAKLAGFF